MKHIYQEAQKVIVWLCPADEKSDRLFDYMNSPAALFGMMPERIRPAFESVAGRGYWSRQWIIQEILFARDLLLVCGLKQCTWRPWRELMHNAPERLATTLPAKLVDLRDGETAHPRHSVRREKSLAELMVAFIDSQCEWPHDKAFSLVGLAGAATVFEVNYNVPLDQILLNILKISPFGWSLQRLQLLFKSLDWRSFKSGLLHECEWYNEHASARVLGKSYIWHLPQEQYDYLASASECANWCNNWYQYGLQEWIERLGFEQGDEDGHSTFQSCGCIFCAKASRFLVICGENEKSRTAMPCSFGHQLLTGDEIVQENLQARWHACTQASSLLGLKDIWARLFCLEIPRLILP